MVICVVHHVLMRMLNEIELNRLMIDTEMNDFSPANNSRTFAFARGLTVSRRCDGVAVFAVFASSALLDDAVFSPFVSFQQNCVCTGYRAHKLYCCCQKWTCTKAEHPNVVHECDKRARYYECLFKYAIVIKNYDSNSQCFRYKQK